MLGYLAKLGRSAQIHQDEHQATRQPKRVDASKLPPTQEAIQVVGAQDNLLILRNGSAVAAVGFGSMTDVLLSSEMLSTRLNAYRLLLKSVRFDFQLLIGTRPQNLSGYHDKVQTNSARWAHCLQCIDTLTVRMRGYLSTVSTFNIDNFKAYFQFAPEILFGTPGQAYEVATLLCNATVMTELAGAPDAIQRETLQGLIRQCDETTARLQHWQQLIAMRSTYLALEVEHLHTPVRTFYFVLSYNPRLISGLRLGPLELVELDRAQQELTHRCAELQSSLRQMRLPNWRVSHDELLEDIHHFYHPSQAQLQHALRVERSVAMRLATVR